MNACRKFICIDSSIFRQRQCRLVSGTNSDLQQPLQYGGAFVVQYLSFSTQWTVSSPHIPNGLQANAITYPVVRLLRGANQVIAIEVQQDCVMALVPVGEAPLLWALVTMPTIRIGLAPPPPESKRSATRLLPSV